MTRRAIMVLVLGLVLGLSFPARAGDGLNLPTELYILLNSGVVQRYGLGAAGVIDVTPDDAFALDFSVAPDNNLLAYRTQDGLMLLDMFADDSIITLEGPSAGIPPLRGQGDTMVWSPNAAALAYTTGYGARVYFDGPLPAFTDIASTPLLHLMWSPGGTYLAAEAEQNIWWIYRRAGQQMTLVSAVPSSVGAAWWDDLRLIIAPDTGGLFIMDLADGNRQRTLQAGPNRYYLPFVRPDASVGVFTGPQDSPAVYQRLTFNRDGTTSVAQGGTAPVDVDGLRWAPGGDLLLAFRGGGIALVQPASGDGFVLPISNAVAYSWGAPRPASVTGFTITRELFLRAPDSAGIYQVWRLPRNGLPPFTLTPAGDDVLSYAVAPNGRALVYVSEGAVWRQAITATGEGGDALPLVEPGSEVLGMAFNPDGGTLALATAPGAVESGIWLLALNVAEAQPQIMLPNPVDGSGYYTAPQFALNVSALMVAFQTPGITDLDYTVLDPVSGTLFPVGRYAGARWLVDGRVVAWRGDSAGSIAELIVIDPFTPGAEAAVILRAGGSHIRQVVELAAGRLRVLLAESGGRGPAALTVVEVTLDGREPDEIASPGFINGALLSPDGEFIAGYTHPGGALVMYNISQGQAQILSPLDGIYDILWALFR